MIFSSAPAGLTWHNRSCDTISIQSRESGLDELDSLVANLPTIYTSSDYAIGAALPSDHREQEQAFGNFRFADANNVPDDRAWDVDLFRLKVAAGANAQRARKSNRVAAAAQGSQSRSCARRLRGQTRTVASFGFRKLLVEAV